MVRKGFAALLGAESDLAIVAEAEDADDALAAFRKHQPDVTLMDGRMPGGGGIEALRRIRTEFPKARVILLSTYDLDEMIFSARDAGAAGYLLKSVECATVVAAIRRVHAGEQCFPDGLEKRLALLGPHRKLSPREQETLDLMRRGLSNREISVGLGVSENTAKGYVQTVLMKLGAADRAEAVALGFERGLLHVEQR